MFPRKILICLILLAVFVLPATATDYTIKIGTEYKSDTMGWTSQYISFMNLSDSTNTVSPPGGLAFTYYQYNPATDSRVWLKYAPSTTSNDILLNKLDQVCLKDTGSASATRCKTDPTNSSAGTVRLTLLDIIPTTTASTTSFNGTGSPIYAYLYVNGKELALTRNPTNPDIFDATTYFQQETGWSADKKTSQLDLYFLRSSDMGADISVIGKRGDTTLRDLWWELIDTNKVHYRIEEEGTYTFTVTYDLTGFWGRPSERKDVYVITTKGISTTANVIAASAPYEVYLPNSKAVTMSQKGTFEQQNGVTINDQGKNSQGEEYQFVFSNSGNYRIKFKGDNGGETVVEFNVKPAPAATPAPTATPVTGNQAGGGEGGWDTGTYLLIFSLVGAVVTGGYLVTRKKKKPKMA